MGTAAGGVPRRRIWIVAAVSGIAVLLASCSPHGRRDPAADRPPPSAPAAASPSGFAATSTAASSVTSTGWTVTVYYTAVEKYHSGPPTRVTGCPRIDCAQGKADLGTYPADFVAAVSDEGTGRTNASTYLNWSYDTGYWLDSAPRDTNGHPLRPFESAAADRDTLPAGTRFSIVQCGREEGGSSIAADVCARLRSARWVVTDEFTPGLGGPRHIDVYVGEESGPGFTDSAWYTTLVNASLSTTSLS
jgi:hypothetical protein